MRRLRKLTAGPGTLLQALTARVRLVWGCSRGGDANAPDLDKAFLSRGASLVKLDGVGDGAPDRLVGYRGVDGLAEYKNPGGKDRHCRLRPNQEAFRRLWRGRPVHVIASEADVDAALESWSRSGPDSCPIETR